MIDRYALTPSPPLKPPFGFGTSASIIAPSNLELTACSFSTYRQPPSKNTTAPAITATINYKPAPILTSYPMNARLSSIHPALRPIHPALRTPSQPVPRPAAISVDAKLGLVGTTTTTCTAGSLPPPVFSSSRAPTARPRKKGSSNNANTNKAKASKSKKKTSAPRSGPTSSSSHPTTSSPPLSSASGLKRLAGKIACIHTRNSTANTGNNSNNNGNPRRRTRKLTKRNVRLVREEEQRWGDIEEFLESGRSRPAVRVGAGAGYGAMGGMI